jgi:transcriptional regulator with XRE-family HTH domain
MAKTTPFGRELRKLRVDSGETLGDIKDAFNLSVAMLSAIETGRKNIPSGFIDKVTKHFSLNKKEARHLEELADRSKNEVRIALKDAGDIDRELVTAFARKFPTLNPEEKKKLKKFLEKRQQ